MNRELMNHYAYMNEKIAGELSEQDRKRLFKYHIRRVRDFQHERLIHLLVTLFFALLLICACVVWVLMPFPEISWPLGTLVAILFVLEIAYIRHYYQLENGVQSLYALTEKLGKTD